MAKRFTDSKIYDKEWFQLLTPRQKEAWRWLCARCDEIGMLNVNMGRMTFEVNCPDEPYSLTEILSVFKERITVLTDTKVFLPGFVPFQYGDAKGRLSSKNRFHLSIAKKLEDLGLPTPEWKPIKEDEYQQGVDTHPEGVGSTQGKGIGKGKGKGQGKGRGKELNTDDSEIDQADQDRFESAYSFFRSKFPSSLKGEGAVRAYVNSVPATEDWAFRLSIENYHTHLSRKPNRPPKESFRSFIGGVGDDAFWRDFIALPEDDFLDAETKEKIAQNFGEAM